MTNPNSNNTCVYIPIHAGLRIYLEEHGYDKVYLTRGKNRCINMFTKKQWEETEVRFREKHSLKKGWFEFHNIGQIDLRARDYRNIPMSKVLQNWTGIVKDVILVYWSNRIEIWAKEHCIETNKALNTIEDREETKDRGQENIPEV